MQGMKPKVAIIAPGDMGAAVGGRLVEHGLEVTTPLEGRSAASRKRAEEAGIVGIGLDEIANADMLLSIVPPGEALALAGALAPRLAARDGRMLYVDCNAVSPRTVRKIGGVLKGVAFVDAGIIGLPPRQGGTDYNVFNELEVCLADVAAAGGFARAGAPGGLVGDSL